MQLDFPALQLELESRVKARTGRQIRNLGVELAPHEVIIHGLAATFYLKQLAQHCVREILPDVVLTNQIVVVS